MGVSIISMIYLFMAKDLYEAKDKEIEEKTGKPFKEWKKLIDKSSAAKKGHTKIVELLVTKHSVKPKWAEALSIKYEKEKYLKK